MSDQPVPQPIAVDEQLRLANQLFDRTHSQIRAVDEKIRALFSANTLLAAALAFTQQAALPVLPGFLEYLFLAGSVITLLSTVGSVIMALIALMPRVRTTQSNGQFFFGAIAHQSLDKFQRDFQHLSPQDALEQVLQDVHVLARIALVKNQWMLRAAILLIVALVMWFSILTINLLARAIGQI